MTYQVEELLQSKLAIGRSKRDDKALGLTHDKIYSWKTYNVYKDCCIKFTDWCKSEHGCRTLADCWTYRNDYIQSLIDRELSAYTIKQAVSALCKLYDRTSEDFIDTPSRHREDITRSRGKSSGEKRFSEANHQELVDFCRCTGLRRSELENLRGSDLVYDDNTAMLYVTRGTKGGKSRFVPIIGTDEQVQAVIDRMKAAGDGKVWGKVPQAMDVHSYRADYATAYYKKIARDPHELPLKERYCCKNDQKGTWYDREAMLAVSRAMGHNRINVIGEHYLYTHPDDEE